MKYPPPYAKFFRSANRYRAVGHDKRVFLPWPLLVPILFVSIIAVHFGPDASPSYAAQHLQATQPPSGPPVVGTPADAELGTHFQLFMPVVDSASSGQKVLTPTRVGEITITPTPMWTPSPSSASTSAPTPTATPKIYASPTATPYQGSAILPPTVDPIVVQCNAALTNSTSDEQVQTVEEDLACVEPFVDLMLAEPLGYIDAFYGLITSTAATDDLWQVSYEMARLGDFRTTAAGVESLWNNLADAIAQCQDSYRCQDWEIYMLPFLTYGELYHCPEFSTLSTDEVIESVPYGDYYCTEDTAAYLSGVADEKAINRLVEMGHSQAHGWSRRNALRVLGRLAEQSGDSDIHLLVTETLSSSVIDLILDRLENEVDSHVLTDAIWVIDTYYFPTYQAQPLLEMLSANHNYDSVLHFRAMGAIARLIDQRHALSDADLAFLESSLVSNDGWVRAQAAFTFQLLEDVLPPSENDAEEDTNTPAHRVADQRDYIISLLQKQYDVEPEFMAKAALAQALDTYNGSELRAALQAEYELAHLPNEITFNHITIHSGLPEAELPAFMLKMQQTESTFYDVLGRPFDTPVPNDPTDAMTLLLFASRDEYREYMNAFVGYGAEAGGLYLEGWGKLYTYQREADESAYTVEHLIQHEFTHYLQGRYIFPGIWTDAGYHTEPKGWVDEGTAEYFGMAEVDTSGAATFPLSAVRLNNICGTNTYASLNELLNRRAGYDLPGTFDYDNGWAFVAYLMSEQKAIALDIYVSLRNDTYQVTDFARITSTSVAELEFGWHQTLERWCNDELQVNAASLSDHGHSAEVVYVVDRATAPLPPAQPPRRAETEIVRLVLR